MKTHTLEAYGAPFVSKLILAIDCHMFRLIKKITIQKGRTISRKCPLISLLPITWSAKSCFTVLNYQLLQQCVLGGQLRQSQ